MGDLILCKGCLSRWIHKVFNTDGSNLCKKCKKD